MFVDHTTHAVQTAVEVKQAVVASLNGNEMMLLYKPFNV